MGVIDLSRLRASRGGWLLLFKISTSLFFLSLTASPLSGRLPTYWRARGGRARRPQDCPPRPRRPPNGRKPQRGREEEVGPRRRAERQRGRQAQYPARPPADPLWGEAREGVVGPLGSPAVSREGENGRERSRRAGRALSEAQRQPTCLSLFPSLQDECHGGMGKVAVGVLTRSNGGEAAAYGPLLVYIPIRWSEEVKPGEDKLKT